jgi:hypothetical protein
MVIFKGGLAKSVVSRNRLTEVALSRGPLLKIIIF